MENPRMVMKLFWGLLAAIAAGVLASIIYHR